MSSRLRTVALGAATTLVAGLLATVTTALPATSAHATSSPATISGVLTYDDGTPAAGKPVTLEGERLLDLPVGSRIDPLPIATTTTDALGRYSLTAPASTDVVTLANDNEGVLNATVKSVFEEAPLVPGGESDSTVYAAAVGIVFDLVDDPVTGLGFVGPGTVNLETKVASLSATVAGTDTTVSAGVPGVVEPTVSASPQPEPDEETSTEPVVNNAGAAADEAQGTASEAGVDTSGVVGVDSTTVNTVVDTAGNATGTSALINDIRADATEGGSESPHKYPSNPCVDDYYGDNIRYAERYVTYAYNKWVVVGELHVPSDTYGTLTYKTSKMTSIGTGIRFSGSQWEVSGSSRPSKTYSGWNGWKYGSGTYGRHIKAMYRFHDIREYYCKGSSRGSVVYNIIDYRKPVYWNYDIAAGSTDLRNWDSKSNFDRARAGGRAQRFYKNNIPGKSAGDGYNYTWETCVLGLCVGSETDFTTETSQTWDFKGNRDYYWLFGNNKQPLEAQITYAYG